MRRLKVCYICKTWSPDAETINGTVLCLPCQGDVLNLFDPPRYNFCRCTRRIPISEWQCDSCKKLCPECGSELGRAGEPEVATLGEGPDDPPDPYLQLELPL